MQARRNAGDGVQPGFPALGTVSPDYLLVLARDRERQLMRERPRDEEGDRPEVLQATVSPRRQLAVSGDNLCCHNWGGGAIGI